jgi:ADP-heptose:LPS heptosyltransferase
MNLKQSARRWLFLAVRGCSRILRQEPAVGSGQRILFLQFESALGAAINATPVFEAVKSTLPASRIVVAASGLTSELLRHNPFIDRLIDLPNPDKNPASAAFALLQAIRREQFDYAVTDIGNAKGRAALLCLLSGARRLVGFTAQPESYDVALERDPGLSVRANNLRVAAALTGAAAPTQPRIWFSRRDAERAEQLLQSKDLAAHHRLVLFITQTSGSQPSRWFDDRFAILADRVAADGCAVAFIGSAHQRDDIESIRGLMRGESANLAGETDIAMLSALLCRSDLVVTLDTGPMHLAEAVGVPTVIIAPAWQPAHEWLPLGSPTCAIVRRNDIPCRECRKFYCNTHECMDEIGVDEVFATIETMWAKFPPSPRRRAERLARNMVTDRE